MDSDLRTEFNRLWGEMSRIDKELAVVKFKVEATNKEVTDLQKDLDAHLKKKWDMLNASKDRKSNVKIAIIGAHAIGIPSLIAIIASQIGK